jgi:ABC-type polysaccharide/polyol phosphate transport system ATPase subunit
MDDYRAQGAAMAFVSHSADTVRRVCHRAAWLDHGQLASVGPVDQVLDAYQLA